MDSDEIICPVCLTKPFIPIELDCKHFFCYLCLKGSSTNQLKCPICRRDYLPSVFIRPNLQETAIHLSRSAKWSYKGNNGFWLFDQQTNDYLENAYQHKQITTEIVIAGRTYVIDFPNMVQYRKDSPRRKRSIKREEKFNRRDIKGIAGVSKKILKIKTKNKRKRNKSNGETSDGASGETSGGASSEIENQEDHEDGETSEKREKNDTEEADEENETEDEKRKKGAEGEDEEEEEEEEELLDLSRY